MFNKKIFFNEKTAIGLIIFFAAIVRLWGISFGFPQIIHIDEKCVVHYSFRFFTGDFNPYPFFDYPTLHLYLLYIIYFVFFVLGFATFKFNSLENFAGFFWTNPAPFYLLGRIFTVILSLATIYLVYRFGKKISTRAALLGSFFLAFLPGNVLHSHYTTVDISSAFFVFLAFCVIYEYWEKGDLKILLLAGVCSGLAAGIKYNGGLIFVSLITAAVLAKEKKAYLFLSIFAGAAAFFLTSPYILIDFKDFYSGISAQYLNHVAWGKGASRAWLQYPKALIAGMGGIVFFLSLLGCGMALCRREARLYLILSFPLFFWVFMGSWRSASLRQTPPFYPFLAILAAWFVDFSLNTRVKKNNYQTWIMKGLIVLFLFSVLPGILKTDYLLAKKDTRVLAHDWLVGNIPAEARILRFSYTPEFFTDHYNVELDWFGGKKTGPFNQIKNKYDYLIISGDLIQPEEFKNDLQVNARQIAVFKGEPVGEFHNRTIQIWKIKK